MLSLSSSSLLIFVNLVLVIVVNVDCNNVKFNSKVVDFFPSDLTAVTWAHAVNSIDDITKTLDSNVTMLEADLTMGKVIGDPIIGPNKVIMAHPPALISDLSFEMFLQRVLAHNANNSLSVKGIKLDFKSLAAVEPAFKILNETLPANINFPIWINADVLSGPVNAIGAPVNATEFLRLAGLYRPGDTLSLGWKTRFGFSATSAGNDITAGEYTEEHVEEMIELLKTQTYIDKSTPITFPLRTGIASQTMVKEIENLLNSWEGSTITLWHGGNDTVNMSKFKFLVNSLKRERCFIDVGFKYDLEMPSASSNISKYSFASIALIFLTITFGM